MLLLFFYVMLNLPVIITPLRTYLYGQTNIWIEVVCLQHLLIEYLEKDNFLKIAGANFIFVDVKLIIKLSRRHFFCRREIIWVRKTSVVVQSDNFRGFLIDWAKLIYIEISFVSLQQATYFCHVYWNCFETITYNVLIILKNVNK